MRLAADRERAEAPGWRRSGGVGLRAVLIGLVVAAVLLTAVIVRELDRVAVYGRTGSTSVYELIALSGGTADAAAAWIAAYERGLALYRERRWAEAVSTLQKVAALKGEEDRPASLLIERARQYTAMPPPADWNGIEILGRK